MAREVKEWIGKNDDTSIPPRVKIRVKSRANDCCENCHLRVRYGGQIDHTVAIVNWVKRWPDDPKNPELNDHGNRESNLRFLCRNCHSAKTAADVSEKSKSAETQKHLAGFKSKGRGFWPRKPKAKLMHGEWRYWIDDRGIGRATWCPPEE